MARAAILRVVLRGCPLDNAVTLDFEPVHIVTGLLRRQGDSQAIGVLHKLDRPRAEQFHALNRPCGAACRQRPYHQPAVVGLGHGAGHL